MKKTSVLCLVILMIAICCSACGPRYSLRMGAYEFKTGRFVDILTDEVTTKSFDDIFNDREEYTKWHFLFAFSIRIDENTKYLRDGKRWFVRRGGLAFELTGDNELQLYIPRWSGADNRPYEVTVTLGWAKTYG